jgi:hypothetical protein
MYYVPDGTTRCGFYECKKCMTRFLSLTTDKETECPDCAGEFDPEIGPDDEMPSDAPTALLLQVVEGEEEVEKMDTLLSLAITGGDYNWI